MVAWKKQANGFTAAEGPFIVKVMPKGDGRWNWEIYVDGGTNPTATGVRASVGAAKTTCEQFLKRSGRV